MTVKAGKNLLVKVEYPAGSGTYIIAGGLQTKDFAFEAKNIEVTNHGSNEWQEFIEGAGVRKLTCSGSGVHNGDNSLQAIEDAHTARTNVSLKLIDDDGTGTPVKTYTANFKVPTFNRSGEFAGEQKWSASFMSNGAVTVT